MKKMPSISQYLEALKAPERCMSTLTDMCVLTDVFGEPVLFSGNNAGVFKCLNNGLHHMVKCYTKHSPHRREIYSHIEKLNDPLLANATLLHEEATIFDATGICSRYDILYGDWYNDKTLETRIRELARDKNQQEIANLSATFDKFALQLISRNWAHGDIKPENIIIDRDGKFILIDLDAFYHPDFDNFVATEIGTPGYNHPKRGQSDYGKYIDDYPLVLISVILHALSISSGLFNKYKRSDCLLIHPNEILEGRSECYEEILDLFSSCEDYSTYFLALALKTPTVAIPNIKELFSLVTSGHEVETGKLSLKFLNGYWGYENGSGEMSIPAIFDEATEFREEYAVVKLRKKCKVIDTSGKVVINEGFDDIKPFSGGLAAASSEGLWGYIDINSEFVIKPTYLEACSFRNGVAAVRDNSCPDGEWVYIDSRGNLTSGCFD